ncbi:MAG: hypothetical protein J6S45_03840, partial [Firmicutes bacterium]|nr:hypothetical protein [Bacillota bacterium]
WETGDAQPALAQLIALADALDISLDVLCGRIDPAATASAAPVGSGSPFGEATPAKPADTAAPTNHRARRRQLVLRLLLGILIGSVLTFGINGLRQPEIPQSTGFPDTIEVTGLYFYGSTYRDNVVDYEFVPSYVNPALTYTIHFHGALDKETHSFEVKEKSGVFSGSAQLPSGNGSYLVTLEISDEREGGTEESRLVALASGLVFNSTNASWSPITSIVEP